MTYPKVSTDATAGVPSSPNFPEIEERVLAYWEDDDTFQASVDQRDAGRGRRQRVRLLRRPAVRQRPAALRPPAHRLRQGPDPALPDDARQAGRAPLRLGHPRPARRARGDAPQRHQDHRRDPRAGHREVQRGLPASVMKYTGEWRDYVTRQARWVDFDNDYRTMNPDYMESVIWAFKQLLRQGPGLRGLPGAALLLERRDAAVQPRAADGRRRLPDAPGPGRHRRATT